MHKTPAGKAGVLDHCGGLDPHSPFRQTIQATPAMRSHLARLLWGFPWSIMRRRKVAQ